MTHGQLQDAALKVGVRLDMNVLSATGLRHRVKVNRGADKDAYRRTSASYFNRGRRVNAVCWHGFRDFFRACFELAPNAVFKTSLDTWKGQADFEARYQASGFKVAGPPVAPVTVQEVCLCQE
jgi:hypothetical protein